MIENIPLDKSKLKFDLSLDQILKKKILKIAKKIEIKIKK